MKVFISSALFSQIQSKHLEINISGILYNNLTAYVLSADLGVINSRGLSPALITVGGFTSQGLTNSVTCYHMGHQAGHELTSVPYIDLSNPGVAMLDNELYVVGGCEQSLDEGTFDL